MMLAPSLPCPEGQRARVPEDCPSTAPFPPIPPSLPTAAAVPPPPFLPCRARSTPPPPPAPPPKPKGLRRRLRPRRYSARLPPAPPLPLLFCRRPLRPSPRGRVAVRPARCDPEARCQPPPQPQRRPAPECCFLRCTRQPTEQPLARPHAARSPAGNSGLGPAAKRRIAWRAAGRDPAEEPQGYSLAGRLAARCGSGGGHPVGHVAGGQGAAGAAVRRVHVGHGRAGQRPPRHGRASRRARQRACSWNECKSGFMDRPGSGAKLEGWWWW